MDNTPKSKMESSEPNIGVSLFTAHDLTYNSAVSSNVKSIKKSLNSTSLEKDTESASEWLTHNNFEAEYQQLIDNSTILPQCIESYKNNVAGFGIGVRYKTDYKGEETPEMTAEYDRAKLLIDLLTIESDTKELFMQMVNDMESSGIAYLEIIRDKNGLPVEAKNISSVNSITKSKRQDIATPYIYYYGDGQKLERKRRFRKYKQEIGGKVVYFKEFGDMRVMDKRTGKYITENEVIHESNQANEIYEFKKKNKPYGDIRWIGCVHSILGSWYSEQLNLNYFKSGRHTPLAICIENGRLSAESRAKLQDYTNAIKGENGQHAFLLIEAETIASDLQWNKENPPHVTMKELASVLQKDELFGEYIESCRRKVQSSFNLPDIYVGYTTDFNRATAYAAMTITEQQVFQPYRNSLEWSINNILFNEYAFKYVEFYFEKPDFTNPDDIATIFAAAGPYGGIPVNLAKEVVYEQIGKDCNDYDFEGADLPLAMLKGQGSTLNIEEQLEKQVAKAESSGDDDIVPILKSLLKEFKKMRSEDVEDT